MLDTTQMLSATCPRCGQESAVSYDEGGKDRAIESINSIIDGFLTDRKHHETACKELD